MRSAWALLAFAACSAESPRPPSSSYTVNPGLDSGVLRDSGYAQEASADAHIDAGTDAHIEPMPPQDCANVAAWSAPMLGTFSTTADDGNPATDGMGLEVFWTTLDNGAVRIHYVSRARDTAPWNAEASFLAVGVEPGERIAPTSDGMHVYAIATGRRSLVEYARASSADAFTRTDGAILSNLNQEIQGDIADLVVAESGRALLYRKIGAAGTMLALSLRLLPSDMWPPTGAFANVPELATIAGKARRPTGLARDLSALFYWDEVNSTERIALFPNDGGSPNFVDIGARRGASPTRACTEIYFSAPGVGGGDIFSSKRM
jgi:hypothetical protein